MYPAQFAIVDGDSVPIRRDSRDVSSTIRSDALTVLNGDSASTDSRDVSSTKKTSTAKIQCNAVHLI